MRVLQNTKTPNLQSQAAGRCKLTRKTVHKSTPSNYHSPVWSSSVLINMHSGYGAADDGA